MKMKKVKEQKANYPLKKVISPIFLSISVAVALSGCASSKSSPPKPIKPTVGEENNISIQEVDKNSTEPEEEPVLGGVPLPPPDYNVSK